MLFVDWVKGEEGVWWTLDTIKLYDIRVGGVYVIWHGDAHPKVIRVGQGQIDERLAFHKKTLSFLPFRQHRGLSVTWAPVQESHRNGVERYLGDCLRPLMREDFSHVLPTAVNLPFLLTQ